MDVVINEVGPRDGLQNQPRCLSPAQRLCLIKALLDAGLPAIEAGAFVSPKAVPAMASSDEVLAGLPPGGADYSVLIPNLRGYQLAREAGAKTVAIVIAATDSMNRANINRDTATALAECEQITRAARDDGIVSRVYIATAWQCPYEGAVSPAQTLELAARLHGLGADALVVADTIGAAAPESVQLLCSELVARYGPDRLGCHFHDTRGLGTANAWAAWSAGVRRFDASIGGLGGCPFAPGATGNVATEDLVALFMSLGIDTGIEVHKLIEAVDLAAELTGRSLGGRALGWLRRQVPAAVKK